MMDNEKIDAVYTWVNGDDPRWQMEFNQHKQKKINVNATHRCRFKDHGELFFSLLSLEKFSPWINRIYIVKKAYQTPNLEGLSLLTQDKIVWIDESSLNPIELSVADYSPTFNSLAIEANLHRISNLSERFIYFNNDMFLGSPLLPEYFFSSKGARFSIKKQSPPVGFLNKIIEKLKKPINTGYRRHLSNAYELFSQNFGSPAQLGVGFYHLPLHQCCPLFKSSFEFMWEHDQIREKLLINSRSRFRQDDNLHPAFLSCLISLWLGKAWLIEEDDAFVELAHRSFNKKLVGLMNERPNRFCVNDHPGNKKGARATVLFAKFMQEYFQQSTIVG